MKIFWPLVISICAAFSVSGQSLLNQPVSIQFKNVNLESALYQLIDEADINLSFSNIIISDKQISPKTFDRQGLSVILDYLFVNTQLQYREVGSQVILFRNEKIGSRTFTINGFVLDAETGESVIGAVVFDPRRKAGTYTNHYGFFSILLDEGEVDLTISNLGYEPSNLPVTLDKNTKVEIRLKPYILEPVLVKTFSDSAVFEQQTPAYDINMKQVSRMVSLGGEADAMRTAYTLPGFQTGADGFGGLSVRGGDIGQNLFLLDGIPVYNATHGIGLFSIFNSSAIRSAKILKGSFPARYGGRISSVWDIRTKEGNNKKVLGEADIGLTSVKLSIDGPLIKGKGSYFFSGRRALFDFFSEPISRRLRENGGFVSYHFSDLNLKLNYELSKRDRVYFSYYTGSDSFDDLRVFERTFGEEITSLSDSEKVNWGNRLASFRWNHVFSDKIFGNTTFSYSLYQYASQDLADLALYNSQDTVLRDVVLQLYASRVRDYSVKSDFDYATFNNHTVKFGGLATWHEFYSKISTFEEAADLDGIKADTIGDAFNEPLKAVELEFYLEDEMKIGDYVQANLGIRVSSLNVLGSRHLLAQPRVLFTFFQKNTTSYYLSANRMTQFLHLISPSRLGLPKDLWVSATDVIPPQKSWQFALGVKHKLKRGFILNIDAYYKRMNNLLLINRLSKDGVNTRNWQDKVSIGKGKSYGTELLLQKQGQQWGGWLSYTLAWSNRSYPDGINDGKSFPIKLDRRHNFNIQLLYKLNEKWDISTGFNIASGVYYNLPTQEYNVAQIPGVPPSGLTFVPISTGVNNQQLPAYHRLDLAVNRFIKKPNANHTLKLGITNAYNRLNPFFRTLRDKFEDDGTLSSEFVEVSLLPIFPTLRYVMQFK